MRSSVNQVGRRGITRRFDCSDGDTDEESEDVSLVSDDVKLREKV